MREEELTMIQEAVFDSIDAIELESFFAEYDVLTSLADVYVKSAMIQESGLPAMAGPVSSASENKKGGSVGDEPMSEPGTNPSSNPSKEKWYTTAINWIIKAFKIVKDAIIKFFKFIGKKLRGLKIAAKNLRPGTHVVGDDNNVERLRITVGKDGNFNPDENIEVILDFDMEAAKGEFAYFIKKMSDDSFTLPDKAPKFAKKKTYLKYGIYSKIADDFSNKIDEVLKQLKKNKGLEYSDDASTDARKVKDNLAWVQNLSKTLSENLTGIAQAMVKFANESEIAEADKHTFTPKGKEKEVI